jgi:hypothetical protein
MSTTAGLDWDAWRNAYHHLTYAEHQDFYSRIYEQHPEQRHYDPVYVARAIEQVQPRTVVELGGWDGELAVSMLEQYPTTIKHWCNVELCREAAAKGQGRHPRYEAPILHDWYWNHGVKHCDLFVASHVIEHLSLHHLNQTIKATDARALFMDAPLLDQPLNWAGFTGTHILEKGWTSVTRICNEHGYRLAWAEDHQTDPSSGGTARACLYTHA